MDPIQLAHLMSVAATSDPPNLWGALGCALAYSGAVFATVDAFADFVLARGDSAAHTLSPGIALKFLSKIAAGIITVLSAAVVLSLDNNWFALVALSAAFLIAVGISLAVLLWQGAQSRGAPSQDFLG